MQNLPSRHTSIWKPGVCKFHPLLIWRTKEKINSHNKIQTRDVWRNPLNKKHFPCNFVVLDGTIKAYELCIYLKTIKLAEFNSTLGNISVDKNNSVLQDRMKNKQLKLKPIQSFRMKCYRGCRLVCYYFFFSELVAAELYTQAVQLISKKCCTYTRVLLWFDISA